MRSSPESVLWTKFDQLLIYFLTYSMEESPSWEANWSSGCQEIPHILRSSKVHYHIHKCPPPVPILSHNNPIHALTPHFLNIHLNIILPSMPGSSKWFFPSGFSTKTLYTPLLSPYKLYAPPTSFFLIWSPEQYWARRTDHSALHYVVFSIPLFPHPS